MVKKGKIVKNSSLLQTINNINDTVVKWIWWFNITFTHKKYVTVTTVHILI